jgi:hypothetical protein
MTVVDACINTERKLIAYRDFVIEESRDGWEWAHQAYSREDMPVAGTCQTIFDCIGEIDTWYERRDAA